MKRIDISDARDERVKDYVALRDSSLRKLIETENGIFIAEGDKVIKRALEAGYQPRSFLLAPRWIAGLKTYLESADVPVYIVSEECAEAITGFHVHRGALAALYRDGGHTMDDLLHYRRLVVCEDLVDHANVGAIIRCASGLGWDGVLVAPRAADPLYRRAIKASMGTVFSLPWARMTDWQHGLRALHDAGFTVIAMALDDRAIPLERVARDLRDNPRPVCLLLGTEGAGLSKHWLHDADIVTTIPMSRNVDSLNVAAAAAIACYELRE